MKNTYLLLKSKIIKISSMIQRSNIYTENIVNLYDLFYGF